MDYTLKIGGEAGQGVQTVAETLERVFARCGYHLFTHQDYESRVRGGHNFFQIRLADHPVRASRGGVDLLVALDVTSLEQHAGELTAMARVVYDSETLKRKEGDTRFLDVPFQRLALEAGGSKVMASVVATGAVLGMLGLELEILDPILQGAFAGKGEEVVDANRRSARAGYEQAGKTCMNCPFTLSPKGPPLTLVDGTQAIALGALASDCRFYAGYPMTPATGIMQFLAGKQREYPLVVEQAEDEIAAINMALGASYAGVRAMTGTSGGGFALMVEGLSLAAMTETPIVIVLAQRPGPATGLPTRTEQADLNFALYTAHGEFPRLLFAPGTPKQAAQLTRKAFQMAEAFQLPAIILTDQYLADCQWTYETFNLGSTPPRDYRLHAMKDGEPYRRYAITKTGISPLAVPGEGPWLVVADSDEHDEDGHLVEDAATRVRMVDKRLFQKWGALQSEISPPVHYGDPAPELVLVGWGSSYGVLREVVDRLAAKTRTALLHFSEIWPFPSPTHSGYLELLKKANQVIAVEGNATGQFARLLEGETGFRPQRLVPRYDGRPHTVESLEGAIDAYLE
jgi:2-oxoglutarate ferredoxin oxidoreductase subunit alpha